MTRIKYPMHKVKDAHSQSGIHFDYFFLNCWQISTDPYMSPMRVILPNGHHLGRLVIGDRGTSGDLRREESWPAHAGTKPRDDPI